MIDLHCHILPGIDDGAPDLDTALAMARIACADGITVTACTPHIYPGLYENNAVGIRKAMVALQQALDDAGISLRLVQGADVHLTPDLLAGLRADLIPSLNGTRYFLLEPPHHVAPPRFEENVFGLLANGYVPVITHPERLTWIEDHYPMFLRLAKAGAWLQITAGALVGRFGKRPRYWSQRLLDEGPVHIIASDAHSPNRRPPLMAEARVAAARQVGETEAWALVRDRPAGVLKNWRPERLAPSSNIAAAKPSAVNFVQRWLSRR
ncbi:MAG: tyrosine-protein phosphatase [Lysobacterales bacterium]